MTNHRKDEDKPWWNDEDVVGGIAATIALLGLATAVAIVLITLGLAFFKAVLL